MSHIIKSIENICIFFYICRELEIVRESILKRRKEFRRKMLANSASEDEGEDFQDLDEGN